MKKITLLLTFFALYLSANGQTYVQEDFNTEIPATWTITDGGGATGDSWFSGQVVDFFGDTYSLDGTNGAIANSDVFGNGVLMIETLTTPVFDASDAIGLFLDFDQYYNNIGGDFAVVEVFDGTSWVEVLNQTTDAGFFDDPDKQHIDITAYKNANMQVRFVYNDGNVWAWYWMIDNVHIYNSTCNNPSNLLATVTGTDVDLTWVAGGTETVWEVINQVAGGPVPTETDSGIEVTTNLYELFGLTEGTNYEFYVRANCGADGFSIWSGPYNYRVSGPGESCSNPLLVTQPLPYISSDNTSNYLNDYSGVPGANCSSDFGGYLNGDDVVYQYSPAADTSIDIELSNLTDTYAGVFVYTDCADIGISCVAGATNFFSTEDLLIDNFSVTAGTNYYIVISTWASPQSVGYTLTITENTCIDPVSSYNVVSNCTTGTGFFVDVDLTDLGSATSITLTDNQGSTPQTTTATGVFTFGPFANETDVIITVTNDDDANCILTSQILTQEFCQDFIVDCSEGPQTLNYCYADNGANNPVIFTYTSNDGTPLNLTFNSGVIENGWDELAVMDSDGSFIVNPADFFYGNNGDLSGLTYQSTGDTISFYINSDGIFSCQGSGFEPINVTVSCATCINPSATYAVVDDCDNGDQFLIDVNVTSLGDATSLTISNNMDATTIQATAIGTYQMGPFPFLQNIIITLSNDQDINCVINSPAIQLLACPPDNDNCDGATVTTVNTDGTCGIVTPGTILAATPSGVPNGSCIGDPDDDVWFQFTALHQNQSIILQNIVGANYGLNHALYSGTCGTLTEIYCSPNTASATPDLTIGETYYIRVFSEGDEDEITTFNLCITESAGNVIVDQTTYTPEQLVQEILVNSPCAQVSNITYSTGTNFGDENGIGYFSGNGVGFPFEEGIILTTGNALEASGPNVNAMSAGTFNWPGDADLEAAVGVQSNNATIIEFDFIPLSDEISFEFLMASEEYNGSAGGTFECTYSDAFAFLLTDQNGNTTNLAVLPGTTTPILVTNIHPENPGCPAINEEYFGGYIPQNLAPISFDGRTEVFTAYSEVNIGETYHIKLVIADALDQSLDSGVYLKAGSFDIGEIDLGADITIESGTAVCEGGQIVLETNIQNVVHTWYLDGIELEETSSTLVVTEPGEYTAQIIFSPQCAPFDSIIIEFFPNPEINLDAIDLIGCSDTDFTEFTLENNNAQILGELSPNDFTVSYYLTEQEAIDGVTPGLTSPYTNISNPQLMWVRVTNNTTDCFETASFNLIVEDLPITTFTSDFDYEVCPDATVPIFITATPVNYTASEVSITWYKDDLEIEGQTGLTLPVLQAGLYEIEVRFNDTGCIGTAEQQVIQLEMCKIPQGISPNNDGLNDSFDLSSYDVSRLEIFNRNGTLVYSKTNYNNEWYGQTNDGDELPVGTYFYSMIYQGGKEKTGWVYINR